MNSNGNCIDYIAQISLETSADKSLTLKRINYKQTLLMQAMLEKYVTAHKNKEKKYNETLQTFSSFRTFTSAN